MGSDKRSDPVTESSKTKGSKVPPPDGPEIRLEETKQENLLKLVSYWWCHIGVNQLY